MRGFTREGFLSTEQEYRRTAAGPSENNISFMYFSRACWADCPTDGEHGRVVRHAGDMSTRRRIGKLGFPKIETMNKRQDHPRVESRGCIKQIQEPGLWKFPLLTVCCWSFATRCLWPFV